MEEPDLVLWQIGTNDALAYVPLPSCEETVTDTIRWLKEHKVDVVLAGLQYVKGMAQDSHYAAVRELMRKIAADENVIVVRRYEAMQLMDQAAQAGWRVRARRIRAHRGRLLLPRPVHRAHHHARRVRQGHARHRSAAGTPALSSIGRLTALRPRS